LGAYVGSGEDSVHVILVTKKTEVFEEGRVQKWSGVGLRVPFFSLGDAGFVDFCPFEAFDGDAECICLLDVGDGSSGFFVNDFPYPYECVLGFERAFGNLFLCCYRGAEFDSPSFVNPQLKVLPQFCVFKFMLFVSLLATFLS
jgi:hypothetical protein